MSEVGRELDWDDQIEKDSADFVLLPEGDYEFKVTGFDRARHNGSAKLPACPKAIVHIEIEAPEGICRIDHNLFLYSSMEGLLSAFFASIGLKQKGEKVRMNWNAVPGATGKCKVIVHEYTNQDGEQRKTNRISKFYVKEAKKYQAGVF